MSAPENPQGQWRPIETAPRDGTEIVLAIASGGLSQPPASYSVHVGWYETADPYPWRFIDTFDLTPTGCCEHESDERIPANGVRESAAHFWMPLPAPPESAPS